MSCDMVAIHIIQEALVAITPAAFASARDERGASAVEYALLVALIAIFIIAAVTLFGRSTAGLFQESCDSVASTQSSTC